MGKIKAQNYKKQEKRGFAEWLSSEKDIPCELFYGGCYIEIHGRNGVILRGCKRIMRYSDSMIMLKMYKDVIKVCGKRLSCVTYLQGEISIDGLIDSVEFVRKNSDTPKEDIV